jgi:hypothetical protein
MLRLPDEILLHIADVLRSRTASHLCRRLWTLLGHRHLTAVRDVCLPEAVAQAGPRLRSLVCNVRGQSLTRLQLEGYGKAYPVGRFHVHTKHM